MFLQIIPISKAMDDIVPIEVLLDHCCVCVEVENTASLCLCFKMPLLDNQWHKTETKYLIMKIGLQISI